MPLQPQTKVGGADPSSVKCVADGGTEVNGDCVWPDGTRCNSWAYFRGECAGPAGAAELEPEEDTGAWKLALGAGLLGGVLWWSSRR